MKKSILKQNWILLLHGAIFITILFNLWLLLSLSKNNSDIAKAENIDLELILLNVPDCEDCFDLAPIIDDLKNNGVTEDQINLVEYDSRKGKQLIEKYNIKQVPTAIVEGNIAEYSFMNGLIENVGEIREGSFILTMLQPPFIDLEDNTRRGDFEIIYLSDKSCEECYDVKTHDIVLERLIMTPTTKTDLDITEEEAIDLIEEYGITVIPTIILKGDLSVYNHFNNIWETVGSIEEDGAYVLRKGVESMGGYKELSSGTIITPEIN